ncbi:MAG: nuclear transport factor 2 family protein [Sphingomonadaceae bacterium]|nr:nuclear transport factor 2 family protein [Sphingomonadaceae bacterium]
MFEKTVKYPPMSHYRSRLPVSDAGQKALKLASAIAVDLRTRANESDEEKRIPADLLARMSDAEFFRMGAPTEVGGGVVDYPVMFRAIEELATGDGSAGWCVLTNLAAATMSACLAESGARKLWPSAHTVIAGSPVPGGRAIKTDQGYRILPGGRWHFASNSGHATHFLGGFQIVQHEDDPGSSFPPKPGEPFPISYVAYFDRSDVELIEGSGNTIGLKGTRSGGYTVKECVVAEDMVFRMFTPPGRDLLGIKGPLGIGGHAAVFMGVARHALETFYKLANEKTSRRSGGNGEAVLAEHPVIAHEMAHIEASFRAARAQFYDIVEDCWARWNEYGSVDDADYLECELANVHAASVSRDVVNMVCKWAATSAVFEGAELDRCRRDVQTATGHVAVQDNNLENYGLAMMGQAVMMGSAFDAAGLRQSAQVLEEGARNRAGPPPAATEADLDRDADLRVAHRFVAAMIASDIDACQAMMADDIVMDSPMGPREGPNECAEMLRQMNQMGSTPMELPVRENGDIVAINHAPIGDIRLVFTVANGMVSAVGLRA